MLEASSETFKVTTDSSQWIGEDQKDIEDAQLKIREKASDINGSI